MGRIKKLLAGLCLCVISNLSTAEIVLPDLGEPYPIEISYDAIVDTFLNGQFINGVELLKNKLVQELKQKLNDEKTIPILVAKLAEEVQRILSDTSKNDKAKGAEILKIIEMSMASFESLPAGGINLAFKHSIEYGVTRLTWDHKIEVDECKGVMCGWVCVSRDDYNDCNGWQWSCKYWTDYVYKVPDYYIYRIVGGKETLITKLKGVQQIKTETVSIGSDVIKSLQSIYNYDSNFKFPVPDSKALFYDVHSDWRRKGETLAYKVVTNNSPYKAGQCGDSESYNSMAFADGNGDGLMDFIPQSEYSKYFGKYFGWIIPVTTTLFE